MAVDERFAWVSITNKDKETTDGSNPDSHDEKNVDNLVDDRSKDVRYWVYTVFEDNSWQECQKNGFMVIGLDEIGDYTQYDSQEAIRQALIKAYGEESSRKFQALFAWNFSRVVKHNDIIFAKRANKLFGKGIITGDYIFDKSRPRYKNVRAVKWLQVGEWEHSGNTVEKRLTDITPYTDYIEKLNAIFASEKIAEGDDAWWPSKAEYDPGFTVEQWTEMMSNPDYLEEPWEKILAMFYAEKDGASCKQIGEKYGMEPSSVRSSSMQLAQRIFLRKNCPLIEKDGKRKMWPILFVGRDAKPGEKGNFIWKLRPELYEALTNVNILQYLNRVQEEPEPMQMTVKEIIEKIKVYIAGKGFTYENGLVENFWLCLKSKPFVILAGTSGTGKTRLVKLFAEAIGAEYRLVPVRPDWSDPSDLLGHYNLEGVFVPGRVLKIILEAQKDPEKPYILCLDEMNLARVEYYLSDFLSIIETRDLKDGKIVSDRLLPFEDYGDIRFPENLYLVGTVNMDETTFPFSKKVLDRANTIEFNTVDLMPAADAFDDEVLPIEADNSFLKSEYLFLNRCMDEENREFIESVCRDLEDINRILKENNAHVGYRVRDEIVFYMLNNKNADLLNQDEAMDNAVMQKILPRIQGSSASVKDMLCELFKIFAGDFEGYQTQNNDTASGMFDKLSKGNIRYPKSAAKTAFMVRRFDEDGFTSYWL